MRFRANSGYERNDLFAGQGAGGLVLLLCERAAGDLPSPNCLAIDRPLAANLSFSYRFKRAYLARWREIASGVERAGAEIRTPLRPQPRLAGGSGRSISRIAMLKA